MSESKAKISLDCDGPGLADSRTLRFCPADSTIPGGGWKGI